MLPLLLNKIIQTDKLLFLHLVTQKNRIYTFLNPVSYLIALENKSLFEQFDGIFADGSLLVSAIRLVYGKRVTRDISRAVSGVTHCRVQERIFLFGC